MALVHDFWLLREDEHSYQGSNEFVGRRDAPVQLHDDIIGYVWDSLQWIPTLLPSGEDTTPFSGFNRWGKTIIHKGGGAIFQQICLSWAQLFAQGPRQLHLQGPASLFWPFEEDERTLTEDQVRRLLLPTSVIVDRDVLIQQFRLLAQFGAQAATGTCFILHLGI